MPRPRPLSINIATESKLDSGSEAAAAQDHTELLSLTGRCTYPYDELAIGKVLGKGASSVVVGAVHSRSQARLALKVVNVFDKGKRQQLLQELTLLYNIRPVASIVTFHGAYVAALVLLRSCCRCCCCCCCCCCDARAAAPTTAPLSTTTTTLTLHPRHVAGTCGTAT